MFFQLELVKIAQTPLPPTSILIEKTKWRETTCFSWKIYLCNIGTMYVFSVSTLSVKFPTILKQILVKNKDCDFCFFYIDKAIPPHPHLDEFKLKKHCEIVIRSLS